MAIIMDGNGRWARQRGLPRIEGHGRGVQSVRSVVEEGCRLGIAQLTLYCLSIENWKRPEAELDFLMRLLREYLLSERAEIMDQNIRFTTIGRRDGLPTQVLAEIDENVRLSRNQYRHGLCLPSIMAAARSWPTRSGRWRSKSRRAISSPMRSTKRFSDSALYTAGMPDPDLLIRTAGEMRVSNFLLWQISYAELWVTEKCWPGFDRDTFHEALRDYARRERRFGGLKKSKARRKVKIKSDGISSLMLRTRLWMGAILVLLTAGVLVADGHLSALVPVLARPGGGAGLGGLLRNARPSSGAAPAAALALFHVRHCPCRRQLAAARRHCLQGNAWHWLLGTFSAVVIAAFLVEMARFREPGQSVPRDRRRRLDRRLSWLAARVLGPAPLVGGRSAGAAASTGALWLWRWRHLRPQVCGHRRLLHWPFARPAPYGSRAQPEEDVGRRGRRVAASILATIGINRLGPVLQRGIWAEVGFGREVGVAGMLGDLAESLHQARSWPQGRVACGSGLRRHPGRNRLRPVCGASRVLLARKL